jgi:hypothetical protein
MDRLTTDHAYPCQLDCMLPKQASGPALKRGARSEEQTQRLVPGPRPTFMLAGHASCNLQGGSTVNVLPTSFAASKRVSSKGTALLTL